MATNKSIQDIIFKSRLTIKYRTEISGTPVEAKLPFRVLVLGDFSGESGHKEGFRGDLSQRPVYSITKGITPDHVLRTLGCAVKVSQDKLKSHFPGTLRCSAPFALADLKLPSGASGELSRTIKIASENIHFSSERLQNGVAHVNRCEAYLKATLRFSTMAGAIDGFLGVKLMLRGRVYGEKVDAATSKVVGSVSGRIKVDTDSDTEITLAGGSPTWTGTIPGGGGGTVTVTQSQTDPTMLTLSIAEHKLDAERTLPLPKMDSFTPDAVAESLPGIRRLFLIKQLLQELKAEIQSRPELRKALNDKLKNNFDDVKALSARLQAELPELKI